MAVWKEQILQKLVSKIPLVVSFLSIFNLQMFHFYSRCWSNFIATWHGQAKIYLFVANCWNVFGENLTLNLPWFFNFKNIIFDWSGNKFSQKITWGLNQLLPEPSGNWTRFVNLRFPTQQYQKTKYTSLKFFLFKLLYSLSFVLQSLNYIQYWTFT